MSISDTPWQKMQSAHEQIVAVDEQNKPLRAIDKIAAHRAPGVRHRAITVVLINERGEWLITQRSAQKPLWPRWWDAACSTHQWWLTPATNAENAIQIASNDGSNDTSNDKQTAQIENDLACARRRLPFELGLDLTHVHDLHTLFTYQYAAIYNAQWAEKEWNHVVVGQYTGPATLPDLNLAEVATARWQPVAEIRAALAASADHQFAPWVGPLVAGFRDGS